MKVKFKVKSVEIDKGSFDNFIRSIGETNETLIFNGRYALIREFGVPATVLNEDTIAEITKDYMDAGLPHDEAYNMATSFAQEVATNGFNSMPFLRPAIDDVISRHTNELLEIGQIGGIINEILLEAISNYERDGQKAKFTVPMDVDVVKE